MLAATIDRRGIVSIREIPVPSVGRREVRIAVDTAGVGGWDAEMRPEGVPSWCFKLTSTRHANGVGSRF